MLKISQNIEIIKVNLNTLNFVVNSLFGLKIHLYTVCRGKKSKYIRHIKKTKKE